MSENSKPRHNHSHTSKRRLIELTLVLVALVGVFVWLYLDNQTPKGTQPPPVSQSPQLWLDFYGEPRTANVTPRTFCLWEFYPDDTVRCVNVVIKSNYEGTKVNCSVPCLYSSDDLIDVKIFGGELINISYSEWEYRENTYEAPTFTVLVTENTFGYDVLMDRPPYLHILTDDNGEPYRLISIGYDPQSYYAQSIDAIAIPLEANVTSIYDYHPYRHITLGECDIFYYDTTDITGHRSIHITYEPAGEASSLDWAQVEAAR